VVQAACEFRFEPGDAWDMTIPGLIYERLRDDFPLRRQVSDVEALVEPEPKQDDAPAPVGTAARLRVSRTEQIQFVRADEKVFIEVKPNILAVHHLRPYPGWTAFLPLIHKGLTAYQSVAKPRGFTRIGLRYINRLAFQGPKVSLENYLDFYPFVGSRLPQDYGAFVNGIELAFDSGANFLRLQLAAAMPEAEEGEAVVVALDLDYYTGRPSQADEVEGWLDRAHERVQDVFEGCLKDPLRQRFDERGPQP
jgi:uncharacterized protein (TIGR04255 family)